MAAGKHSRYRPGAFPGSTDSSLVDSESAAVVDFRTSGKWRSRAPGSDQSSFEIGDDAHRHRCLMCCAWVFLVSFAVAVIILAIGFIFVAVLRSALPEVRLVQFDMPWLKVDTAKPDTLLTAVVRAQIEVHNQNSGTELRYRDLWADVSSGDVKLGETRLPGLVQAAGNRTTLQVVSNTTKSVVNEDDANGLKADANNGQLVLDVVMSGYIGFHLGIMKLSRVPLLIACEDIREAQVDFSKQPAKCEVQIFKFR